MKMLDELRDVQAVSECMVCMNGDRHRAPPFCLCNFSESDPRSGIIMGKVPGVRDGREIEPRKHREADQVLRRVAFNIVPLPNALHFKRSLVHESIQIRMKAIVCEPESSVRPVHHAAAVDLLVQPDFAINDAGPEVLDLLRGREGAMNEREKHGKAMVLRVAIRGGAIDAKAHAVEGLSEGPEEVEGSRTLPSLRVDFLPAVLKRIVHRTMIRNGNFGCHFNRMDGCSEPCRFPAERDGLRRERNIA